MATHRAAIIGLGVMGRRMLGNLERHTDFEVVGAWDPAAESVVKARAELPGATLADSPTELITNLGADLLYIACPPKQHKHYTLMAAEAGVSVLTEKPLGVDIAESVDLVDRLEAGGTLNAVNFVQASCQALEVTQRAITTGEIGEISGIDIVVQYQQWPRNWQVEADWLRFKAEGGYVREVISHFIFVTERLLGPAKITFSHPNYPDDPTLCESHIQAQLECAGVPVSIFGSCGGVGPDRQEVTVWGSRESHRITDFSFLTISDGGPWRDALPPDPDPRTTTLQRQLDNLSKLLSGEPHLLPSAREALSVQRVIEGMLAGRTS